MTVPYAIGSSPQPPPYIGLSCCSSSFLNESNIEAPPQPPFIR